MTSLSFHVRHDLTPVVCREVLLLLRLGPVANSVELVERARARDLAIGHRRSPDKVLASLRDLGLIGRPEPGTQGGIDLTSLGKLLADIAVRDELLFAELVHLRHWWLWSPTGSGPAFAWSYQTVADMLWESAPLRIEPDRLVAAVLASAEHRFDVREISFSTSSLLGIQHWLRALSPPCFVDGYFRRRPACSSEALLASLDAIRSVSGSQHSSLLHIDEHTRQLACRSLLLDEAAFDEVLNQAEEAETLLRLNNEASDRVIVGRPRFPGLIVTEEL